MPKSEEIVNNTIPGDAQLSAQILRDLNKQDPNVEMMGCIVLKYITRARQLKDGAHSPKLEVHAHLTMQLQMQSLPSGMREESGQCLEAPRTKPLRPR